MALRALAYPFGLINSWNIQALSAVGDGWTSSRPARTLGMNRRILMFHSPGLEQGPGLVGLTPEAGEAQNRLRLHLR